nr:hypothetical protein [Chromobacterium sp. ASV5]
MYPQLASCPAVCGETANGFANGFGAGWVEDWGSAGVYPISGDSKGTFAKYLDMASVGTSGHTIEKAIKRQLGSGARFVNGDTLLARIMPCLENGKTAFVDFLEDDETAWGSTEFIVMRPKSSLLPYHAYLLARLPAFREFAIQSMSGTSGRQRVQNDVLGRYMLTVPTAAVADVFDQTVSIIQQEFRLITNKPKPSLSCVTRCRPAGSPASCACRTPRQPSNHAGPRAGFILYQAGVCAPAPEHYR